MNTYTYEIWDKVSPINRISAETIIFEHRFTHGDKVYLIQRNNRTIIIQTDLNTPYPADTIEESAQLHIEALMDAEQAQVEEKVLSERVAELEAEVAALKESQV